MAINPIVCAEKIVRSFLRYPARLDWHEVVKVAHYTLSVNALVQPMKVKETPKPYESSET